MRIKRYFHFQALCFIFSGFMLQGEAVAEAEAIYKFKDGTEPFALYKEPYADPPQQVEKPKIKPIKPKKSTKPMEVFMEIGRPEASTPPPAPAPKKESPEETWVESYQRKPQTRPTISDSSVFEEPSKPTTSSPVSSFFDFENLRFIQPAFAKDQVERIVQGNPNPLPHKIFWNQGRGLFQKKRSFLVRTIPSGGLCEENFNPIEIRELNSNQPAKQRCVQKGQSVLIEVSKDEGLMFLNGNRTPSWEKEDRALLTQDEKELKKLEEKYAEERKILEEHYESEKLNLKETYVKARGDLEQRYKDEKLKLK